MATSVTVPGSDPDRRIGLRERNKIRTRTAIREAAMALFADQGYTQTTVEQIARKAGVSHTTFFRYFSSKEQVVISDDLDEQRDAAMASIPPGLGRFDLLRHLVTTLWQVGATDPWVSDPDRMRLIQSEPVLRMAHQIESERAISDGTEFFADYMGVPADSPRLQVFVAAAGGLMFHFAWQIDRPGAMDSLYDELMEAIDLLEQGLPL